MEATSRRWRGIYTPSSRRSYGDDVASMGAGRPKFHFHTGGGQCGLCAVRVADGAFGPRYEWEERHVAKIGADARLACQTTVKGGDAATVTLQAR